MRHKRLRLLILLLLFTGFASVRSQVLVESIAAIVGDEVVLLSDVENLVYDMRRQGIRKPVEEIRCEVFEELLVTKLFLDQARIDSIIVTDDMVENDLNVRINNVVRQVGSEAALEEYFRKSMVEIRRDIRKTLKEQQIAMEVQSTIASNLSITPAELRRFVASIPKDSLPLIPSKVQVSLIQLDPPANEDNKAEARQKLLDLRSEILAGKSFSVLAILNSEDPGSAGNGGEIGFRTRGELEKEYADAAFSLSKNQVSRIVETRYGFHLIQLIERKGDLANTRHILIRPKVKDEEALQAIHRLDSIADMVRKGTIRFEEAALRLSSHKDSRINGGKLVNPDPSARVNWFTLEELGTEMYLKVRDLKIGEISEPFRATDENGNVVFRIVRLDDEIPAHRANLKDDYQILYNAALQQEVRKAYSDWISRKIETTYIRVSEEFKSCSFLKNGWLD